MATKYRKSPKKFTKNNWEVQNSFHRGDMEYQVSINRAKSPRYFKKIESSKKGSKIGTVEYFTTISARRPSKKFRVRF